jgi:hypothetical protein
MPSSNAFILHPKPAGIWNGSETHSTTSEIWSDHKLHHGTQIARDCKLAPASIFLLTELRWLGLQKKNIQ